MLREFDCGAWMAPTNGTYQFRFTVAGRNSASASYQLSFDYLRFTPATTAPRLSVAASGSDVILSWPASAVAFRLEYSPAVPGVNWSPVSAAPVVSGSTLVVTNPVAGEQVFYRLRWSQP